MSSRKVRAHVFISFRNIERDQRVARDLRKALLSAGFDVWWREDIQCGGEWNRDLDIALRTAGCIVVLWSAEALNSPWVRHEASAAIVRGVYAPVRIDAVTIEAPFDRLQATDIPHGTDLKSAPGFALLLRKVEELLPPPLTGLARVGGFIKTHGGTVASAFSATVAIGLLVYLGRAATIQASTLAGQAKRLDEQVRKLADIPPALAETSDSVRKSTEQIQSILMPRLDFSSRFGISGRDDGYLKLENMGYSVATIRSVKVNLAIGWILVLMRELSAE